MLSCTINYKKLSGKEGQLILRYEDFITTGEFVRNIAVNCAIDPDTNDGITSNVMVFINQDVEPWSYNPEYSLFSYFGKSESIIIQMEEI